MPPSLPHLPQEITDSIALELEIDDILNLRSIKYAPFRNLQSDYTLHCALQHWETHDAADSAIPSDLKNLNARVVLYQQHRKGYPRTEVARNEDRVVLKPHVYPNLQPVLRGRYLAYDNQHCRSSNEQPGPCYGYVIHDLVDGKTYSVQDPERRIYKVGMTAALFVFCINFRLYIIRIRDLGLLATPISAPELTKSHLVRQFELGPHSVKPLHIDGQEDWVCFAARSSSDPEVRLVIHRLTDNQTITAETALPWRWRSAAGHILITSNQKIWFLRIDGRYVRSSRVFLAQCYSVDGVLEEQWTVPLNGDLQGLGGTLWVSSTGRQNIWHLYSGCYEGGWSGVLDLSARRLQPLMTRARNCLWKDRIYCLNPDLPKVEITVSKVDITAAAIEIGSMIAHTTYPHPKGYEHRWKRFGDKLLVNESFFVHIRENRSCYRWINWAAFTFDDSIHGRESKRQLTSYVPGVEYCWLPA